MRNAWQTVGFVVVAVVASLLIAKGPPYREMDVLGLGIAVVAAGCLLWRRVAPLSVLTADAVLVVVNSAAGYSPTVVPWVTWMALFTCFSLRGGRVRLVAVAVTLGVGVAGYLLFDRQPVQLGTLFSVTMSFLFAVVAGDAARSRDLAAAAEQARRRAEERTELARELHDSVGHAVNVMVMQAGVGRRVFANNPEFAREALGHIEEAVTNTLRHTENGRIDVGLRLVGNTAVLEVVNEGSALVAGTDGRGLANMRERARRVGGECEAGPFDGGFRVRATLPATR